MKTAKESIANCYGGIKGYNNHNEVIENYLLGMKEAYRILKKDGLLWVKCQDEIESGKQKWNHIEIKNIADKLNFITEGLFILVQKGIPAARWKYQKHARKNHSFLWIFRKKF